MSFPGVYAGIVRHNNDPERRGRLRIVLAELGGDPTDWAEPCIPWGWPAYPNTDHASVGDHGAHYHSIPAALVPPNGSGVWVAFVGGDENAPVWLGTWTLNGELGLVAPGAGGGGGGGDHPDSDHTSFAPTVHTHALPAHTHALEPHDHVHNHDSAYSPVGHAHVHNHDGTYSPVAHNHDSAYATASHTHGPQTDWTNVTSFGPGWTTYPSGQIPPSYRKLANGLVICRGLIRWLGTAADASAPASAHGSRMFTFPAGFRHGATNMSMRFILPSGQYSQSRLDSPGGELVYIGNLAAESRTDFGADLGNVIFLAEA